ncbi:hypothetical protein BD560DRAFT_466208 [Blakeslea trispora]|nr:hypothetical protein BD560DRAFT_466208 [Blakeslea trispora]
MPNAKTTQLIDGEAKLRNMMKLMVDRLVVMKIPSPVVCGMLDSGTTIKTYKMTVEGKGRYELVQLACFGGTRFVDDLVRLPNTINHLNQLKHIICSMQQVIRFTVLEIVLPGPHSL